MEIPAAAQVLLGTDAVAHVWTSNPDGSPQISVVWVLVSGDEILFGTDRASRKANNLARDPAIILSVEDTERNERGFQRHLVIRGHGALYGRPRKGSNVRLLLWSPLVFPEVIRKTWRYHLVAALLIILAAVYGYRGKNSREKLSAEPLIPP